MSVFCFLLTRYGSPSSAEFSLGIDYPDLAEFFNCCQFSCLMIIIKFVSVSKKTNSSVWGGFMISFQKFNSQCDSRKAACPQYSVSIHTRQTYPCTESYYYLPTMLCCRTINQEPPSSGRASA